MLTAALQPANDNAPFSAEFENIPLRFLQFYEEALSDWAKRLDQGNQLTIRLLSPPNSTILSLDHQGSVNLRCDAFAHPISKKMRFVVKPCSEEDAERIRKHCEALPGIVAAHHAADQAKRGARPRQARWVFDGTVPEYFVLRYQFELREWARNLKQIGTTKHVVLREGALADPSPAEDQGPELIQVSLTCKAERVTGDEIQIVVSAADERQEWLIRRHCEKMQRHGIPPGAVLVEPARPGLPLVPNIGPVKSAEDQNG